MLDIENGIELFAAVCCCEKCAKVLIHGPHPPSLLIVATKSQRTIALARGQAGGDDVKTQADDLAELLRQMSDASTREIENLISELQAVRKQLQNAGNRIQRDIAEYATLSQKVMQLTDIISDSLKNHPFFYTIQRSFRPVRWPSFCLSPEPRSPIWHQGFFRYVAQDAAAAQIETDVDLVDA